MKIAVAGLGLRAVKVLNYLVAEDPEMRVVGYVDPQPVLLPQLTRQDGLRAYDTVETMLDGCGPDLLFVGSPNHLHLAHIRAGLQAGVRVFAEKPVVHTMDDTWELAELLRTHGAHRLMVGLVLRYSQLFGDLKRCLDQGQLGELVSMEANEHIGPYHGAFFMRDWRRYIRLSGGFMLEKCCHDLDLYNQIAGARPDRVASFGDRRMFVPRHAPGPGEPSDQYLEKTPIWNGAEDAFQTDADIVDHQTALLRYENGISLAFHTTLNAPDKQRRFCVFGSHGMAEGEFQKGYLKVRSARTGAVLADIDYLQRPGARRDHYGADAGMARVLTAYLRDEIGALPVSALDAMEAGIVALAIDAAMHKGDMVDLTETWARLDAYGLGPSGAGSRAVAQPT